MRVLQCIFSLPFVYPRMLVPVLLCSPEHCENQCSEGGVRGLMENFRQRIGKLMEEAGLHWYLRTWMSNAKAQFSWDAVPAILALAARRGLGQRRLDAPTVALCALCLYGVVSSGAGTVAALR